VVFTAIVWIPFAIAGCSRPRGEVNRCAPGSNGARRAWFQLRPGGIWAALARTHPALYLRSLDRALLPEEQPGSSMSVKIPSPCIGVCVLDPVERICTGCLRTADEIAAWPDASPAEQVQIVLQLKVRRRARGITSVADSRPRRRKLGLGR
jgi:predicted Fe-S protein YdhL (DUF1289 family)